MKLKYKYYLIYPNHKKFITLGKNNNKSELFKLTKTKIKKNLKKYAVKDIILLRLKIVKEYKPILKSKKKLIKIGPIKVEVIYYQITKRGNIKMDKFEKRGDMLFYTEKYLDKKGILIKDLKRIVKASINNKLQKKLLAPKFIDQINKI